AELARRHGDYAIAGLAATARANGKTLTDVRLAFFSVGVTPVRAHGAEAALAGGGVGAAVAALAPGLDPPPAAPATRPATRRLAGVLTRRVAKQLMEPRA